LFYGNCLDYGDVCIPAALRRQAGQRQSSAAASGIGNRYGSSAHQQPPPRLHSNAAPQRAQASFRGGLGAG
jgi:hypothetical protein